MLRLDLHMHSTASDGTDAPGALARLVQHAGLDGFALTDHDTVAGLAEARETANELGLRFVPGIELSADPASLAQPTGDGEIERDDEGEPLRRGTLHILGYHVESTDPGLRETTATLQAVRGQRNPQIVSKLQELGVNISDDEVVAVAGGSDGEPRTVGRPHIAQVLVDKGYARTIHEAFTKYIGRGAPAYTRKDLLSAERAIAVIHGAGGLAVLAHPVQLKLEPVALEHAVAKLKEQGLDGLETRHSDHEPADRKQFEALADRLDLIPTGGSDYHGSRKSIALGSITTPQPDAVLHPASTDR